MVDTVQDWEAFARHAHEFHRRNAAAWVNDRAGTDLTAQIDPDFQRSSLRLSVPDAVSA